MTTLIFLLGLSAMPADSCPYVPAATTLYFRSHEAFEDASQRNELAELLVESIKEASRTSQVDAKREQRIQRLLKALTRKEKDHGRKVAMLEMQRQGTD